MVDVRATLTAHGPDQSFAVLEDGAALGHDHDLHEVRFCRGAACLIGRTAVRAMTS